MTTNTAGLSDLEAARTLSRRLVGLDAGDAEAVDGSTPYLRFAPTRPQAAATAAGAADADGEPLNDFTRWDEFLAWGLIKARSSAVFAVDPQGFVIGSSGNVPPDGFEGAGAELSYVMSQADAMDPEMGALKAIGLEFANQRMTGVRAEVSGAEGFVIAFVDAETLDEGVLAQITRQLEHSFNFLL
jgi:hypothetical protein